MTKGAPLVLATAVALAGLAACSGGSDARVAAGHSHEGGGMVSMAVGVGTQVSEVG